MPDITISFSKEWYIFKIDNVVVGQLLMTEETPAALARWGQEVLAFKPDAILLDELKSFITSCNLITPLNKKIINHLAIPPRVSKEQESLGWFFYKVTKSVEVADAESWRGY